MDVGGDPGIQPPSPNLFGATATPARTVVSHMTSVSHNEVEPVTDYVHENSWSANLEKPVHADDCDLVVEQAVDAVEHTAPDRHVNLVTHGAHGHPKTYLHDALAAAFGDRVDVAYVEQCGCGGHVTRVTVHDDPRER